MNIKLHVALYRFFSIYRLIAPILACAVLASASPYIIGVFALIYFAPLLLTWLLPVECINSGCTGRMELTSERTSFWLVNYLYKCDNCGVVFQEKILDPNIEITVEFG